MIRPLIGVCTAEMARRAQFYDYFYALEKPDGTCISFVHGQSIANSRNLIVKQALENGCSHVLFIDDDTAFKPDILIRLLSHNKDIVTGLHLMRNYPHRPLIFDRIVEGNQFAFKSLSKEDKGLIRILGSGLGACLIKCKVFSKLEEPWFRLGEIDKDGLSEDLGFFKRVHELGLEHYCDLDCHIGHMASVTVWPTIMNEQWTVTYDSNGDASVSFPQVSPEEVKING